MAVLDVRPTVLAATAVAARSGAERGRRPGTRDAGALGGAIALPSLLGSAFAPVPVLSGDEKNRHCTGANERYM